MASRLARRASAATYRGSVKAVVFDWAGTLVDYGSLAPVKAMGELFKKEGIDVDEATARGPMGRNKKDHIMVGYIAMRSSGAPSAVWPRAHLGSPSDIDCLSPPCVQDILKSKHIEKAWFDKFGSYADDEDVAELYAAFGDLMAAQVTERATPIPGVIKSVGLLRAMGVKLGSCSGYDERTMSTLVPAAKKHGLELEAVEW
jgi:phosphonoacetaldehyde hydrolase